MLVFVVLLHLFMEDLHLLLHVFIVSSSSTPKHGDCLQKKKQLGSTLEQKLDLGLDRTLSAIVSYVRHVLTLEQKRTDFKPEDDDMLITNVTVVSGFLRCILMYYSSSCVVCMNFIVDAL